MSRLSSWVVSALALSRSRSMLSDSPAASFLASVRLPVPVFLAMFFWALTIAPALSFRAFSNGSSDA